MGLLQLALAVRWSISTPFGKSYSVTNFSQPSTGLVLAMYKPSIPAVVPTPESYIAAAAATNVEVLACAPMFLEAWSRVPENVEHLKKMRGIVNDFNIASWLH